MNPQNLKTLNLPANECRKSIYNKNINLFGVSTLSLFFNNALFFRNLPSPIAVNMEFGTGDSS